MGVRFGIATQCHHGRYRSAMARRDDPPNQTLGQLNCSPGWAWFYCNNPKCAHRSPLPFAPFAIRWGAGVSGDVLCRNLKCSVCGHRGASLSVPSWRDMQTGFEPFPVGWRSRASGGSTSLQ